jgi:hypothetical protein
MKNRSRNKFRNLYPPQRIIMNFLPLLFFSMIGFSYSAHAQFFKKAGKNIDKKSGVNSTKANSFSYTEQSEPLKIPTSASNYNWFTMGAKFYYKSITLEPSNSFQSELTVKNLYNEGNLIVSELEIKTSLNNVFVAKGSEYIKFKSSGDSIYLDFTTALKKSLLKLNPALSLNKLADTGFMSIPVKMVEGQVLPDVNFSQESGLDDEVILSTSLTNRKIERPEKITTPAGIFDCVKISGTRNNLITTKGVTKPSSATTIETIWLAPEVGIVKEEATSTKKKLNNIQYLTSFKK